MGCDIHLYVEVRDRETYKWEPIAVQNPYQEYVDLKTGEKHHPDIYPYHGRDYELFGILAGVRCDIYDRMTDFNRGLPVDASDYVRKEWGHGKDYFHSATWYTLSELRAYGANKKNFHSVNYKNLDFADELDEIKKDDKSMRRRFNSFVDEIDNFAELFFPGVPEENVRAVMWFDS